MFLRTKLFLFFVVASIIGVLAFSVLNLPSNFQARASNYEAIEHPTSVDGILAGCGGIFEFSPPAVWYGTVPEEYQDIVPTAPMMIPSYGYMDAEPFNVEQLGSYNRSFEGFTQEETLRALWDGVTIIYYDDDIDQESYESVSEYVNSQILEGEKYMLVPYKIKGKQIPMNRTFAFAKWNTSQSCELFDLTTFAEFEEFTDLNIEAPNGDTPPLATTDDEGELRRIVPSPYYD